jgi:hypothetical protein
MRSTHRSATLGCAIAALIAFAFLASPVRGQSSQRQPGLYESTSKMSWQQSPFPQGASASPNSPWGGGPRTTLVCITQAMIDKFDGPPPQTSGGCQMTNYNRTATGMTGTMVCTGQMSGNGNFEAHWNPVTATGVSKIHFTGTMTMGQRSTPVEWTMDTTSTYKGPDCGSVKPPPMPAEK